LEEGAAEFFLKPVTDVNKLRPHMIKTKCKESGKQGKQQQQQQTQPNNKRKSVEGLSPKRTRPRYDGL
jgi:two-component response regulator ARR-A family